MDSLKISGAVIDAISLLFPDSFTKILGDDQPNITFTDLFPVVKKKMLFPKPKIPLKISVGDLNRDTTTQPLKEIKSMEFMTIGGIKKLTELFIRSGFRSVDYKDAQEIFNAERKLIEENFPYDMLNRRVEFPGLSITHSKQNIFVKEEIAPNHPYFTYFEGPNEIITALSYLQDAGISKKRSVGLGSFRLQGFKSDIKMGFNAEGLYLVLSPFIPSLPDIKNIDFTRSVYEIDYISGLSRYGRPFGIHKYISSGSLLYLKSELKGRWIQPFNQGSDKKLINFSGSFMEVSS